MASFSCPFLISILMTFRVTLFFQVKVLEKGLQLHDELTTKDLRPFHLKMETCFAEMKARVTGGQRKATRPNTLPVLLEIFTESLIACLLVDFSLTIFVPTTFSG